MSFKPRSIRFVQIGRRKAIQLELLLATMTGSTTWFLAADYERVMAAVKDFLHEQVRDGTLGGKEHRKAKRSDLRLTIGIEVRTAREQLVILQPPDTLIAAAHGPDVERSGKHHSACVRTQPVTLRVRVSPTLDKAGGTIAVAVAANPVASAATAAPGAGSVSTKRVVERVNDDGDRDGDGDGDSDRDRDRASAAQRGGKRGGKRPRLEPAASVDAGAPPRPSAAAAAAATVARMNSAAVLSEIDGAELAGLLAAVEPELWEIFKGKRESQRHQLYRQKGAGRASLRALVFCGTFTARQQEVVLDCLINAFCGDKKKEKYMKYVADVLFPETLIRIAMQVATVTYPQAEELLEKTGTAHAQHRYSTSTAGIASTADPG